MLTVAGGLASTVFAPLTAALTSAVGWRDAYLVLAGLLAVVTLPLHAWGLRGPWPPVPVSESAAECAGGGQVASAESRGPRLWATAVTFALAGLAAYAVVINLVPLLRERGESLTTAGLLLGLGGIGQVVGRVGFLSLATRSSLRIRTVATLAAMAATTALLGLLTGLLLLASVVVVVAPEWPAGCSPCCRPPLSPTGGDPVTTAVPRDCSPRRPRWPSPWRRGSRPGWPSSWAATRRRSSCWEPSVESPCSWSRPP